LSKFDELYRLHRLLDGRRTGIPRAALIGDHGFARSTLARLIANLRDKLGAPLVHDGDRGGYRYDTADGHHSLPGLWFTPSELLALVTLKQLLANLEPGLLDDHLRPLQTRIDKLLQSHHLGAGEAAQRIRLLSIASRRKNLLSLNRALHSRGDEPNCCASSRGNDLARWDEIQTEHARLAHVTTLIEGGQALIEGLDEGEAAALASPSPG